MVLGVHEVRRQCLTVIQLIYELRKNWRGTGRVEIEGSTRGPRRPKNISFRQKICWLLHNKRRKGKIFLTRTFPYNLMSSPWNSFNTQGCPWCPSFVCVHQHPIVIAQTRSSKDECSTGSNNHLGLDIFFTSYIIEFNRSKYLDDTTIIGSNSVRKYVWKKLCSRRDVVGFVLVDCPTQLREGFK